MRDARVLPKREEKRKRKFGEAEEARRWSGVDHSVHVREPKMHALLHASVNINFSWQSSSHKDRRGTFSCAKSRRKYYCKLCFLDSYWCTCEITGLTKSDEQRKRSANFFCSQ